MKSNVFTTLLQGALVFSILFSMMLCVRVVNKTRTVRALNNQMQRINATRSLVQMLATDCLEYSKKNPAINPMLISVGLMPTPNAGKPAAR